VQLINIELIKPNPKNPRTIKDDKFKKLVKSLLDFPQMLEKRPLVCFTDKDGKYVVLGGNMRLKAAKDIGIKALPILLADDWTEEQKAEFLIKDNVGFGDWNWDELNVDWDTEQLEEWGLDLPKWAEGVDENNMTDKDIEDILDEEFDPIGSASDLMKVVFIFDNEQEAETFMTINLPTQEYKKTCGPAGKIWQVNLSESYGKK
jgi:ParB-like chromosome segregation protein Spo0J